MDEFIKPNATTRIQLNAKPEYTDLENCFYKIEVDVDQQISVSSDTMDASGKNSFVDFKFAKDGSVEILGYRTIHLPSKSDNTIPQSTAASNSEEPETPGSSIDEPFQELNLENSFEFGPQMDIKRISTMIVTTPIEIKCDYASTYNKRFHNDSTTTKVERIYVYRPFSKVQPFILVK